MAKDIDRLMEINSVIDTRKHSEGDFGYTNLEIKECMCDMLLVEMIDESSGGSLIQTQGGIYIPDNAVQSEAWRKGRAVKVGSSVRQIQEGDICVFPNKFGVRVSNVRVAGRPDKIKSAVFLTENRIFCTCNQTEG